MIKKIKVEIKVFIKEFKENFISFKKDKNLKKQIPNLITFLRLLLLPIILILIVLDNLLMAGILTIIAVLTDLFDGFFARKFDAVSKFGGRLDSISDKIFAVFILIALTFKNYWLIIPVLLDVIIGISNSLFVIKGRDVKTSIIGKVKTLFLNILICSLFFTHLTAVSLLINPLLVVVVALQLITLFFYLKTHLKKGH